MTLSERPILVTGGAGLIGSALVRALNERGRRDIIVCDILGTDSKWRNLVPLRFADYLEAAELLGDLHSDRLSKVETIFHLGACSSTVCSDAAYLIHNNYEFTRRLAEWAVDGNRRFIYASSAATYGDGSAGMTDGHEDLHRFRPLNMYGYSKHLFDLHARSQGWLDRIVGLKYFNIFGPGEDHKGDMRSMVHKAFGQIKESGRVQLFKSGHPGYADGRQLRDFMYVEDAVNATIHLAESPAANGLFNVGSGKASTWIDLVTPIFEVLQLPVQIDFVDLPPVLSGKYQYHTQADIERLMALGWRGAKFSLEEAVKDYVANYLVPSVNPLQPFSPPN
jgi:ADP-L-glycero-D-manno-heptose 6-epimerase